jgi:hypothetical protein
MSRRFLLFAGVGIAAVSVGATMVIADHRGQPQHRESAPLSAEVLHRQAPQAAAPFAVLSKRHRVLPAADRLAAITARMAHGAGGGMAELRSIHLPGAHLVIGVGTDRMCLSVRHADGSGSSGCAPTTSATNPATPMMAVDYLGRGHYGISGLMVNGTKDVTVLTAHDATDVQLVDNVFSVAVGELPSGIAWTDPDGRVHQHKLLIPESRPANGVPH